MEKERLESEKTREITPKNNYNEVDKEESTKETPKTCKQNELLKEYITHLNNSNEKTNENNRENNPQSYIESLSKLDKMGWSLLHSVCSFGHEDVAATLLETKLFDINSETQDGWTPLMLTIKKNNYDSMFIYI